MDVLTLLIVVAFYLLLAASIRQYIRHPHALELAVVLVFASTAGIFAISAFNVLVAKMPAVLAKTRTTASSSACGVPDVRMERRSSENATTMAGCRTSMPG